MVDLTDGAIVELGPVDLVAVDVQGMTGEEEDSTSLPCSKVRAFSVETAGTSDLDAELDLWSSGLGRARLEAGVCASSQVEASSVTSVRRHAGGSRANVTPDGQGPRRPARGRA